ncbi:YbaB/EbfC family nucleoid-associated protein [Nocardia sp. alder85J]|uniref:YbaB/EbfC family nucleoid-associated protein n=1 Tax=Nocardia sp. alder85J TaxID=2862949 RepID=UPI001CD7A88E|nr:YbaB/EbfC family nucleoid-associated protein [Nocardia sp. alder85J]MCX4095814.1 YbaB/EbfC family nucleoid-associated protein [Nocardia sp. alder85J]
MRDDPSFAHEMAEVARELEEKLEHYRRQSDAIASIEATAQSHDGSVHVRANAVGALLEVKLGPATTTLDRAWVGRAIVELTQQATREAAAKAAARLQGVRDTQDRLIAGIGRHSPADASMLRKVTEVFDRSL